MTLLMRGSLPGTVSGTRCGVVKMCGVADGVDRSSCPGLVGRHDPQFADGGMAGTGDHVGDAVGDVLGGEDLDLLVEAVDRLANVGLVVVVRAQLVRRR
ncbi:hypothetical protein P3T36_005848 [Kitasatospora sp. MAP12-15]|uniref:hypothetical protein n=1 Tax=unclassified Kitasatospora TaxID=2633591 RepID=UPI002476429D|nr:hypothetical protein [Kitasatospora sp. MAP12-44]MDH6110122.1 hypothetical protein [Kitasatospora sp. MAP12-44]